MKKLINSLLLVFVFAILINCESETIKETYTETKNGSTSIPTQKLPAPTNLVVTPNNNLSITLTWTPVQDAGYYVVLRTTDASWENYIILTGTATSTVYTDNTIKNGVTYFYKIGAKKYYSSDPVGELSEAVEARVTINQLLVTSISVTAMNDDTIMVTWNSISEANKYRIYRGKNNTSLSSMEVLADVNAPQIEYFDQLLEPATYYYRISVINSEGIEGNLSTVYNGVSVGSPSYNLTATPHGRVITLAWDPIPYNTIFIYGSFNETGPYALIHNLSYNATAYNVSSLSYYGFGQGLEPNTRYYFRVSTSSNGPMSDTVSATTGP